MNPRVARTTKPTNPSQGATRQGKAPCVVLGLFSGIGIFGLGEWTWAVLGCSWVWGWSVPGCVSAGLGLATHTLDLAGGRALFSGAWHFAALILAEGQTPLTLDLGAARPQTPSGGALRGPLHSPHWGRAKGGPGRGDAPQAGPPLETPPF
jgi:hypothetical protein